jgi:hypothetical protein
VAFGLFVGGVFLVVSFDFLLFLIPAAVVYFCLRRRFIALGVLAVVCFAAAWAIPGRLDREIGPMAFVNVTLGEVAGKFREDFDTLVLITDEGSESKLVSLTVAEPISRREVLERLATEAGMVLKYRRCASGGTLLFGCHTAAYLGKPSEAAVLGRAEK